MAAMTAATGWSLAALISGLALAVSDVSARPLGAPPQAAAAARSLAGGLDADVRARNGGRLLGHLHGHLRASGRGVAVFTPAPRRLLPGDRLDVRAGARGARRTSMRAGGSFLRLSFAAARDGTVRGRGRLLGRSRLKGRRVRIAGVAGDRIPHLRKGLRMLVVGRPRGEGYKTLKRHFRPVRYRAHHTRRYFLKRRRAFHSFGALIYGGHLGRRRIAEHRLLRAFYGAGKWVIAAPAPLRAHRAVGEVHPYVASRPAPALAVRQVGPEGEARRVKATVPYPEPGLRRGPVRPNARQRRESAQNRAEFFLSQLRRMAAPHMATAQRPGAGGRDRKGDVARAAQLSKSTFSLPPSAAAIEIMVPVYHEWTMSATYNVKQSKPCGWNQTTWNAWCEDTYYWQQVGNGDKAAACQWFMDNGYHILDQDTVMRNAVGGGKNSQGAYTVYDTQALAPYLRQAATWGDECPKNRPQTGNIQGTDYYFGIFEGPAAPAHTIVAASDLTVSATNPPKDQNQAPRLTFQGDYNGRGRRYYWARRPTQYDPGDFKWDGVFPKETAWFLGAYDNTFTLTGANVGTSQFEYQHDQSVPGNIVDQTTKTTGDSFTTSFNIGIFDDVITGGYGESRTKDASTTITIPSWKVIPAPGGRTITYNWRTNAPVSWDTIAAGGGGPHDLNPMNITDMAPSSITSWSGAPTWGKVSITVERTVHLIDHSSYFDRGSASIVDGGYHDTPLRFADGPDDVVPSTAAPIGSGINFCDPLVMWAKLFGLSCAGLQATISVTPVCSSDKFANQIKLEVGALKIPDGPGLSCNQPSDPVPVGTGSDADVEFLAPITATAVSATCTDSSGAVVAQKNPLGKPPTITVPGSALKPQTQITCKMTLQ
jgi:hypothetical protein